MIKCPNKAEERYRHLTASFVPARVARDRCCARSCLPYDSWTTGISLHNLRHHWCQRRSRFTMTLIFIFFVFSSLLLMPLLCYFLSSVPDSRISSLGVLIPYFSTFIHSLSYLHPICFPLFLSFFHSFISFVPIFCSPHSPFTGYDLDGPGIESR